MSHTATAEVEVWLRIVFGIELGSNGSLYGGGDGNCRVSALKPFGFWIVRDFEEAG